MKKLKFLKINEVENVLTEDELKLVFGGYTNSVYKGTFCCYASNASYSLCTDNPDAAAKIGENGDLWFCNTDRAYSICGSTSVASCHV